MGSRKESSRAIPDLTKLPAAFGLDMQMTNIELARTPSYTRDGRCLLRKVPERIGPLARIRAIKRTRARTDGPFAFTVRRVRHALRG